MGTKTLLSLVGNDALTKLAPDLNYPQDKSLGSVFISVGGINATGGLTTVLSLTGKFIISKLWMSLATVNDISQVKLTIDGVVIWDVDPLTNAATDPFISGTNSHLAGNEALRCDASFLLEMQTDADTNMTVNYAVRPIL